MSTDFRPSVVILGSTSGITRATAQAFASAGYTLVLAARDDEENAILADDIAVRYGVPCHALHFDAEDLASHAKFETQCEAAIGTKLRASCWAMATWRSRKRPRRTCTKPLSRAIVAANYAETQHQPMRIAA